LSIPKSLITRQLQLKGLQDQPNPKLRQKSGSRSIQGYSGCPGKAAPGLENFDIVAAEGYKIIPCKFRIRARLAEKKKIIQVIKAVPDFELFLKSGFKQYKLCPSETLFICRRRSHSVASNAREQGGSGKRLYRRGAIPARRVSMRPCMSSRIGTSTVHRSFE
jgi:hypothetical protein